MESTSNFPSTSNGVANAGGRVDQASTAVHGAVDRVCDAARPIVDRAASSAHQAVDGVANAARSVQDRSGAAHAKIDSASEAARPAVDRLLTGAHQAVDKLSGLASVAADTVSEKTVQLKEAHARLMTTGRSQVREKPALAVGIAVAAGFILGRILGSRQR